MAESSDPGSVRRRFDALVSGADFADLRQLSNAMGLAGSGDDGARTNPHLRHPRRRTPVLLRVRVELNDANPAIWRRLELRSDLTLAAVHDALQTAYGWTDTHLHRFSIGGDVFEDQAEWFLCPFDVEDGEDEGTPVGEVRLDETLSTPGDVLHYLYDYGDHWDLTLRLEEVLALPEAAPAVRCLDGGRAAPPEDCGGLRDSGDLAGLLADPAEFDAAAVNARLSSPVADLVTWGVIPELVELLGRLHHQPAGSDLLTRVIEIFGEPVPPEEVIRANLTAHQWFLDRASEGGIPLTAAGYLKPADVMAASEVLPSVDEWVGKRNREDHTRPVLHFRTSLQRMGLLRKAKGTLLLTHAGQEARRDPVVLWRHLAAHLVTDAPETFEAQVRLVILLVLATEPEPRPQNFVAQIMTELGWRRPDGRDVDPDTIREHLWRVTRDFADVTDRPRTFRDRDALSPAAVLLVRCGLVPAPPAVGGDES